MSMREDTVTDDRSPSPMGLLRSGVPLSLLLDLAYGPDSEHVLRTEPARPTRHRPTRSAPQPRRPPAAER